ncbi:EAL domain-containing protein [Lichenicola cladoniae]|uniref:EAL domain-containing protein n=1 Tax=Lichenicola cladoniae TaxID=1484109 RepID=A0A6M8HQH7_9PROT|nr:EAL domain-containing protein [Lichenicola cladoniae]NPD68165.1 EAL domain-containing protein [Acetobacteraceae bacterium]QKE90733.1 EAL domain-containing protein [Lichenicola cladoniae]
MTHLIAALLRYHDPRMVVLVLLEAICGSATLMLIIRRRPPGRRPAVAVAVTTASFGMVVTLVSWVTFITALAGTYPRLRLNIPLHWVVPALAMSLLSGMAAGAIQKFGHRSARNAMLGGSLLACGFSCMLFTGMAGLVRPFALAYDLTAILAVMVLGAALSTFALWESSQHSRRRRPWIIGHGLTVLAISVLCFGSLAAILPFDAWMEAVSQPDDLASSPIAIIAAAEAVAVLVLSLTGSLVDNRVAARDRMDADRFRQLADSTLEGILIHRDGDIIDGNESIAALLGLPLGVLRASQLSRFMTPDGDATLWSGLRGTAPVQTNILSASGVRMPVEIVSRVISHGGRPALVTALRDVRQRLASEERIRFLAHHDMLTELPNRVLLSESLDLALDLAALTGASMAVLFLDLDSFKIVNDTRGHVVGDQLLYQVATRLRKDLRVNDFVARVGGDEFVVLQTSGAQPEQATQLARRLIACLEPSFCIDGQELSVGVSVGIALYPQDGRTAAELLKNADIALYQAKEHGLGWYRMFESSMEVDLRERRAMEQDLRAALLRNEFALHFQPIFDTNLELVAFEALVRWMHPTLGLVSPAQFVPVAEACGLIIPLGEWVMRTACLAASGWDVPCRVGVNLSPAQFLRSDLRSTVTTILAETGLPANRLELEITEGVLMENTEGAIRALTELRDIGVRLVLDDFGTGYSSLSYLQLFPFDKLKVDRSFVQRMEADEGSRAIVSAIIAMCRSLNLQVTAEGVETIEQFDLLCARGCHELQGFLLGHPIPQKNVEHFIRRYLLAQVGPPVPPRAALQRFLRQRPIDA